MKMSQLATLLNIVFVAITVVTLLFTQVSNKVSLILGALSLVISISTALFVFNQRAAKKQ
jgi:hypothetical protein